MLINVSRLNEEVPEGNRAWGMVTEQGGQCFQTAPDGGGCPHPHAPEAL